VNNNDPIFDSIEVKTTIFAQHYKRDVLHKSRFYAFTQSYP